MKIYGIEEAQNCLQKLLEAAHLGEVIVIEGEASLAVKLLPTEVGSEKPLKAGSAKGLIKIAEDFDAPLVEFDEYGP